MDQVFTVEETGDISEDGFPIYQSVFPEDIAEYSSLHVSKADAYSYIDVIRAAKRRSEPVL